MVGSLAGGWHLPAWQVSLCVQVSPSLHVVPSGSPVQIAALMLAVVQAPPTWQWPLGPLSKYSLFAWTRNLKAPAGTPTAARPCESVPTQLISIPSASTAATITATAGLPSVPVTVTSTFVT